jgi:cell division protein ZapE
LTYLVLVTILNRIYYSGIASFMTTITNTLFISLYQNKLDNDELETDKEQEIVVNKMQQAIEQIEFCYQSRSDFNIKDIFSFSTDKSIQQVQGIYLWGGVGRGKTHLLDMFYDSLSFEKKLRLHFHRFMQIIHESIEQLGDAEEPLKLIAKDMAKKHHVICLDEMLVVDITDAMLLAELFKHFIENGMTLLFTSNLPPSELYKNGLQRARFLPTIDLIEKFCHVIELKGDNDYRLNLLEQTKLYQLSSDPRAEDNIESLFKMMSGVILHQDRDDLIINYRRLTVKKWESGIVWFTFDMLCNTNRDSSDYIRIATYFSTVMVSEIYALDTEQDDVTRRFINMIDVFYDRHINLVVSAEVFPDKLYSGKRLKNEFKRTISRLNEMQTVDYLAKNKLYKEMLEKQLTEIDLEYINSSTELDNPTRFGDWVNNGRCSDF